MKRIIALIDGTWNKEGTGADTNVAKLDSGKKIITQAFIKTTAAGSIAQNVIYLMGWGATAISPRGFGEALSAWV